MNTQYCKSCHHTKWEQSFKNYAGEIMKTCIDCRETRAKKRSTIWYENAKFNQNLNRILPQ